MLVKKRPCECVVCFLCLFVLVLSGCKGAARPPEGASKSSSQTTLTPTDDLFPKACSNSQESISPDSDYGLPGTLAYTRRGDIRLLGGTPLVDRLLVDTDGLDIGMVGFSPDGKWFAYYTGSADKGHLYKLHLVSASGEEIVTVPEYEIVPIQAGSFAGTWGGINWITDDYIKVGAFKPEAVHTNRYVFSILDAFTGKWHHSVLERLPAHDPDPHYPGTWAFSPDFKRVLSVSRQKQDDGTSIISLVLQDIENQVELWRDNRFYDSRFAFGTSREAAWSADGSVLAFGGAEVPESLSLHQLDQQGVYVLDREGVQLRLITNFSASYKTFYSYSLSWSPSGRYLAFWVRGSVTSEMEQTDDLYLYDAKNDCVIRLCRFQVTSSFWHDNPPIWSPDSRYLAYVDQQVFPRETRLLKVIDIYTGEVVSLAEDISSLGGWSGVWP